MLRLVEIASNPFIFDSGYTREPSKFQYLMEIIYTATKQSEKCIVWSSFKRNVDWLYNNLVEFNPVRVHGNFGIEDRNRFLEKFKTDPTCQVLVATPASLKEGFTLTTANHCIFFDRSFSLDDYLQAQDRIHRISQEKECHIYNLIAENTIDLWIDELLGAKELAARFGQGDINKDEYTDKANFDYGLMIQNILNINKD
jgi:SNF2 family DNA or RNA helicase